ncbi:MAG: hypothetical protein NTW30_05240 [Candidatus Aenigmarchaeota archaeon]|nr:hypothetical protein [Candidatus Aenigmarchaeota archaeon]
MYVYGASPVIARVKVVDYTLKQMYEMLKNSMNEEILVMDKKGKLTGCLTASLLLNLYRDQNLYFEESDLKPVKTVHKNSLTVDEILKTTGKGRSLFVTNEETKRKRFLNDIYYRNIDSEISVALANEMVVHKNSGPRKFSNLRQYEVK